MKIKTPESTKIIVDDREKSPQLVSELERLGVAVDIKRLTVGDYVVDRKFIFERKTISDLLCSLYDGRLFLQTNRLSTLVNSGEDYRIGLIIEGSINQSTIELDNRKIVQGALVKISMLWGIPIFRSITPQESARIMVYAGRQYRRLSHPPATRLSRHHRPSHKNSYKRSLQMDMLGTLPGIGPEKAEQLLEKLGSIEQVFQATEQELTSVEGIGKKTAQRIKWAIREPCATYVA